MTSKTESDVYDGWHFLHEDRRLGYGDGRLVVAGETLSIPDPDVPLILCGYGLHASERAADAVKYMPGFIVERVQLRGNILFERDKACATERHCYWIADAHDVIVKWHQHILDALFLEAANRNIPTTRYEPARQAFAALAAGQGADLMGKVQQQLHEIEPMYPGFTFGEAAALDMAVHEVMRLLPNALRSATHFLHYHDYRTKPAANQYNILNDALERELWKLRGSADEETKS